MVDTNASGLVGEPFDVDVERGRCREFARAVFAESPDYFEGDTPVATPTFLTTTFHWEHDVPGAGIWERLGIPFERALHAEQEYVFHGPPPRAGDRLTARSRVEDVYTKEGRRGGALTFVVTVTEFTDRAGTLVAEARMTVVETAKAPTEG